MLLPADKEVVFDNLVLSLVNCVSEHAAGPTIKMQMKEIGLDTTKKLLPAYSRETWEQCLSIAARGLSPNVALEEALHDLGMEIINRYKQTAIGRAMKPMLKLLGPKRTLGRAQQNFRSGNNFTEARLKDTGPSSVDLWINEPGIARFYVRGSILSGMLDTGIRSCTIDIVNEDKLGCIYRIAWK